MPYEKHHRVFERNRNALIVMRSDKRNVMILTTSSLWLKLQKIYLEKECIFQQTTSCL